MERLRELLGDKYRLRIGGYRIKDFEDIYESQRILEPMEIELTEKATKNKYTVEIFEAFECCAKLYVFNFGGGANPIDVKILISSLEHIANYLNYSYVGYVHQSNHVSVLVGKEVGYQELIKFYNKRSGNELSEMCKILSK